YKSRLLTHIKFIMFSLHCSPHIKGGFMMTCKTSTALVFIASLALATALGSLAYADSKEMQDDIAAIRKDTAALQKDVDKLEKGHGQKTMTKGSKSEKKSGKTSKEDMNGNEEPASTPDEEK